MPSPRRPSMDQAPKSNRAGNPSGSMASPGNPSGSIASPGNPSGSITSPVGGLHPLQPRNQPPQTAARTQPDLSHLPPLLPQSRTALQQRTGKIAIPRLHREPDIASTAGSSVLGDKHRVTHACESCRHRKTKCSGDRPMCKHCEDCNLTCIYEDGKRDRTKKSVDVE